MSTIKLADAWKIIDLSLNNNNGMRSMPSPNIGFLQLLVSSANKSASQVQLGNVQAVDRGDGKVYKVTRRFFPRLAQSTNTTLEYCPTDGKVVKPLFDEVEITNRTVSDKIKIDDELIRCIKESRADYQNSYVNEVLRNHINRLGKEVATIAATGGFIGSFVKCDCDDAAVTSKNLPLFLSNGLAINPVGESILDSDRKQAEIEQQLILVGSTLLDQYRKARQIASGNDAGFDTSLLDISRSIFYDSNLPAAMGNPDAIVAMVPGALQLITYAKNKAQFTYDFEDQMRTTVVDPWLGIEHDVVMSYNKCGAEIELYIQFETNWALVGKPKCWAEQDCLFDGVLDVFKYVVVCADTGYCDIVPACGAAGSPTPTDAAFCESADICEEPCQAQFFSREIEGEGFVGEDIDVADAIAIQINGLPISLGGTFDTGTEAGANGFIAAVQAALASFGSIYSVSGGWDGVDNMDIAIIADSTVTSIVIVSATGTDVALPVNTVNLLNVYDASQASTGATITNLAWTIPTIGSFNGAPSASIVGTVGLYGTYGSYFVLSTLTGSYQLITTDSVACTDTITKTL
jgi:hypothetical protein